MKMLKKALSIVISVVLVTGIVCSCKRDPGPVIMDTDEVKELCLKAGDEFMDALSTMSYEEISNLAAEDLQESYLASANKYQTTITDDSYTGRYATGWMRETLDYMFSSYNHISGTFERIDDTNAVVKYVFATAMYSDGGMGESYEVELTFTIDNENEAVYLTNPEISLDLYSQIISNYAIHYVSAYRTQMLMEAAYAAQQAEEAAAQEAAQPEPQPETIPEPIPEEVVEETIQPDPEAEEG